MHTVQFEYEEVEPHNEGLVLTEVEGLVHAFHDSVLHVVVVFQDCDVVATGWSCIQKLLLHPDIKV